ncbi:phosphatidylinositol-specific phospholipase C [Sphingobacterium paludis]|uniref:1-phosphatidylinositol phosphodiesterase n=1 Tax=Sphingobacterium paludis TaxID=1476465 RepID=A0A4R7CTT1_9SPHI|nr:phosphatidylinositol-specific phospholipase C [Sphingobacterium paludis]TDS11138.1 1-phosphatidylinositol phosphodiesterase [Sphingobacterium paludis]
MKHFLSYLLLLSVVFTSCDSSQLGDLQPSRPLEPVRQDLPGGANWMSAIPGDRSLVTLSIPGTHGSGGLIEPFPGTAKTQNLTIAQQLNAGVRFLDVRCRFINNNFVIHHDRVYQNLNFDQVLQSCEDFLEANPSETIIMSVKEEYTPSGNTMSFEQRFMNYANSYAGLFRLDADVPSLQAARGKIVLVRRFGAGQTLGIQASNGWSDNAAFTIQNPESTLQVQDIYRVTNNTDKWNAITSLFNTSNNAGAANKTFFLNFTSGFQNPFPSIPGIPDIPNIPLVSNEINPRLADFFKQNPKGYFGVVITDLIYPDLAKSIYYTNF